MQGASAVPHDKGTGSTAEVVGVSEFIDGGSEGDGEAESEGVDVGLDELLGSETSGVSVGSILVSCHDSHQPFRSRFPTRTRT